MIIKINLRIILFLVSLLAGAQDSFAEGALYTIPLKKSTSFEVVSGGTISVYSLSAQMKPMVHESRNRAIEAADYDCGTTIKTTQPKLAVQDIMRQIAEKTGSSLGSFMNTQLTKAEPTVILMAAGENSVWHIALTPKGTDIYVLTLSYLIDEKKSPAH